MHKKENTFNAYCQLQPDASYYIIGLSIRKDPGDPGEWWEDYEDVINK